MSTQSPTDFEWSVKIIGGTGCFGVGIASELRRNYGTIDEYDENAIFYWGCTEPIIDKGMSTVHSDLEELESGDVIRFRFQPKRKKLLIELVSF